MGLRNFATRFSPASPRARTMACWVLFVIAALSLLRASLSGRWGLWLVGLGCTALAGALANTRRTSLRDAVSRYLLFVFLLFFAAQRLVHFISPWLHRHSLAAAAPWIRDISALAVAAIAAICLPRLRGIREASAREHARFLAAAENTLDDFYIFDGVRDADGRIVDFRFSYINPNAERRLRVCREDLIGKILTEVRPFMITSGLIEKYREVVRTGQPFTTEVYLDDELICSTWLSVQVVKLGDGIAITSRDITESKRATAYVHHLAHHDHLTGLANRALLYDRLQQAILRAQRDRRKVAVFLVDIDHFKQINDSLGHAHGDALLVGVGRRLEESVRETDTVARLGGDEFVVVMPDFCRMEEVEHCGIKLVESAARPIFVAGVQIAVTISVGVCICPDAGTDADELLRNADAAMYAVKGSGRNSFRIFSPDFLDDSGNLLELESSRRA
jgi:diguanylate cyclase (GGDEF)-like protein